MDEKSIDRAVNEAVFDALLKLAVEEGLNRQIAEAEAKAKEDGTDFNFPKRYRRKIAFALFKDALSKRARINLNGVRYVLNVAVALLVASNILFLTAPAVRASVWETAVSWFGKYAKFSHMRGDAGKPWEPSYIPSGFYEISRDMTGAGISAIAYSNDSGAFLMFSYTEGDNSFSVNSEGVDYKWINHDEITYHVFESSSAGFASSIVWETEGFNFCVSGDIPIEELLKTAKSVS